MANEIEPIDVPQLRGRGSRRAAKRIYREVRLASGEIATQLIAAQGQPVPDGFKARPGELEGEKKAQDHAKRGPRQTAKKAGPQETLPS